MKHLIFPGILCGIILGAALMFGIVLLAQRPRTPAMIILITVLLFGCAQDTPRIVINNCVDELPQSAIGWYTRRKIELLNTVSGYRKVGTPRPRRGLAEDQH